ncbi:glycosyltransferase [Auraticoccus monumenti]|uniref:Glycosyltransferase involved in cell wall bisynthesis n=1 Tax=Auraticoccus monumenti TaxID=675864 RepID=A0A1G6VSP8_9ACTN|nr:glycosyltransferase [Auraticoccus monumenti]SDD56632.1 Glycosyltransferase involved in cell wall bisynthesis [Auraticoccus monumenti]
MESLRVVRPTTNPYMVQLCRALESTPDVTLRFFSFRAALLGRYDVLHLHWPEILVESRRPVRRWSRRLLVAALVLRLHLTRSVVVRTKHNLHRPEGIARVDHWLLDRLDRLTRVVIRLNDRTPVERWQRASTIPHGHYRDWFEGMPHREPVPGRLAYVGLVRRYKGVEHLIAAFSSVHDPRLSLHIAGRPSTAQLASEVRSSAGDDRRITLDLRFLDDPDLVEAITGSELVVLPYRHMHNSGTVLAALSLDRPVLVPDNDVNRDLAVEVGDGWVHCYEGELSSEDLIRVTAALRLSSADRPDLTGREWDTAGRQHREAFLAALA